MNWLRKPDKQLITPVYLQIKNNVVRAIEEKRLGVGDPLPSIHKLCADFGLAPGTVIRAYEELREMGILTSRQGKGYYVLSDHMEQKSKIFLLFDRMNAFKEILYESFRKEFDDHTDIQVFFHHYKARRFEKLIRENLGKFSHYVLMPHLQENKHRVIHRIPEKKLVLIDSLPDGLHTRANAVYQDFEGDIFHALEDSVSRIKPYKAINLSLSQSSFQFVPKGSLRGFSRFCEKHGVRHEILQSISDRNIRQHELYIIFDDRELMNTLKLVAGKNWQLGRDLGIISYDDSPMKELLAGGISVLSTDFKLMGETAAGMVKGRMEGQIANPFQLILRSSF